MTRIQYAMQHFVSLIKVSERYMQRNDDVKQAKRQPPNCPVAKD